MLFSATAQLQAQSVQSITEVTPPRYAFSVEPLYLYNGALRVNAEKRIESNNWLELNIAGYWLPHEKIETREDKSGSYFTSNSNFERFAGLGGASIGGTYKHFLSRSFFMSLGVSYTCYRVWYTDFEFNKYREDDLTFYEYRYQDFTQIFNKFAGNFSLGARSDFQHSLFIEYYFGIGYARSFYNKNKRAYDDAPFGFGHNGIYPAAGIKLGFNIW
jgi:hypothetical protein